MEHGPEFGVEGHARGEDTKGRDSFLDKLATYGKRCTLLDQSDTLVKVIRGQASAIVCRSNDEAITKAKAQVRIHRKEGRKACSLGHGLLNRHTDHKAYIYVLSI